MEAGCRRGLKSDFVLTVDDVVQLVPVCGCLSEEGVVQVLCSTMRHCVCSVVVTWATNKLPDQSTWYKEGKSAELTWLEKCYTFLTYILCCRNSISWSCFLWMKEEGQLHSLLQKLHQLIVFPLNERGRTVTFSAAETPSVDRISSEWKRKDSYILCCRNSISCSYFLWTKEEGQFQSMHSWMNQAKHPVLLLYSTLACWPWPDLLFVVVQWLEHSC